MAEYWSKDKVIAHLEEKQYTKHADWVKDKNTSYYYAQKQEWYMEVRTKYFPTARQVNWTKERIVEHLEKSSYEKYGDWAKNNHSSYQYAMQQSWFEEVRKQFFPDYKKRTWTKERVIEVLEERKFKSLIEWSNHHHSYGYARKQFWFKEVRAKYFPNARPTFEWTKEKVVNFLKEQNYRNVYAWNLDNPSSYKFISRKGLMKEIKSVFFQKKEKKQIVKQEPELV